MTNYEQCKVFWSWGNHDITYYQTYVELNLLTAEQYKEITGEDYTAPEA